MDQVKQLIAITLDNWTPDCPLAINLSFVGKHDDKKSYYMIFYEWSMEENQDHVVHHFDIYHGIDLIYTKSIPTLGYDVNTRDGLVQDVLCMFDVFPQDKVCTRIELVGSARHQYWYDFVNDNFSQIDIVSWRIDPDDFINTGMPIPYTKDDFTIFQDKVKNRKKYEAMKQKKQKNKMPRKHIGRQWSNDLQVLSAF